MYRQTYMTFGIDRQGVALVAEFVMNDRPGQQIESMLSYSYFEDLDREGRDYTRRLIGLLTLMMMQYSSPEVMSRHAVGPITPATQIITHGSAVGVVDENALMSTHLMLSLDPAAEALELEIVERGGDKRILRRVAVRRVAAADLAERGGDAAAMDVGAIVLEMLKDLYPASFAGFPTLA
ncbi:hypothetical protein CR105_01865 [Massilia eurypsychrophila]|uniref:Uncharacterized protein n=1 Tax=Massilia eurypsychrophila TaxID=1485217 RepID=A0A2G8TLI6_9BURK|nr:hypothetical protein [Massilia eurypsychrophila]PIL46920.1 hypothetical protein CR105_01865 [Massilia eurypsychrophila]